MAGRFGVFLLALVGLADCATVTPPPVPSPDPGLRVRLYDLGSGDVNDATLRGNQPGEGAR